MFKFNFGPLLNAMQFGHWIFLDELNLAQPVVLQRLNIIIEGISNQFSSKNSSEVYVKLPEVLEANRIKVHPNFRLFAAMNFKNEVGRRKLPVHLLDKFAILKVPSEYT